MKDLEYVYLGHYDSKEDFNALKHLSTDKKIEYFLNGKGRFTKCEKSDEETNIRLSEMDDTNVFDSSTQFTSNKEYIVKIFDERYIDIFHLKSPENTFYSIEFATKRPNKERERTYTYYTTLEKAQMVFKSKVFSFIEGSKVINFDEETAVFDKGDVIVTIKIKEIVPE